MNSTTKLSLGVCLVLTLGCQGIESSFSPVKTSFSRMTSRDKPIDIPERNWITTIPTNSPRADEFDATIPTHMLAKLLPNDGQVRLASTFPAVGGYSITNVDGQKIRNAADIHMALAKIPNQSSTQIDIAAIGSAQESALRLDRKTLLQVSHSITESQSTLRLSDQGDPWLLIRDDQAVAKLLIRVDRNLGIMHVVLSITNIGDQIIKLPVEVKAECESKSLSCLTVAQTLSRLYEVDSVEDSHVPEFSVVSEKVDYLLPTNYRKLAEKTARRIGEGEFSLEPAFTTLSGEAYPGPAVLADARALSGFSLQRTKLEPGAPEHTGWIVFSGRKLKTAKEVMMRIDLGSGEQPYSFVLP